MSLDSAVRHGCEAALLRTQSTLNDDPDLERWLGLAAKNLRLELRLQLETASGSFKSALREQLAEDAYGTAAQTLDDFVDESLSFRAFPEAHRDLNLRASKAVRATVICSSVLAVVSAACGAFPMSMSAVGVALGAPLVAGAARRASPATWSGFWIRRVRGEALARARRAITTIDALRVPGRTPKQ